MVLYLIPGPRSCFVEDALQAEVCDVSGAPAARADDVVVVARRADDVGVLPAGQVETFEESHLAEQLESTEYRGPTQAETAQPRVVEQFGGVTSRTAQ